MKLLITGASGLLGRALYKEFTQKSNYQVVGLGLKRAQPPLIRLDITDKLALESFFLHEKFDFIIHSAAERHPDVCQNDPETTLRLNVGATKTISQLSKRINADLLYISTDYVFDGTNPPYYPDSQPNPLNFYGQSKLEGEVTIRQIRPDAIILRIPVLYGRVETLNESAITEIALKIKDNKKIILDNWAIRFPTFVDDVAVVCRQMIERKSSHPNFSGIFHWSNNEPLTKYEISQIIANVMGLSTDHLIPDNNPPTGAPRPKNSQLSCSALEELGIGIITSFYKGIQMVLEPFIKM